MSETLVYVGPGTMQVIQDTEDSSLPVAVSIDGEREWLDPQEARDVGEAILEAAGSVQSAPTGSDPRTAWNESVFTLASQYGRLVVFDYQKDGSTSIERRKLRPNTVEDGLATGHDLAREDVRAFRLDRVQGWAKVG